MAPSLRRAHVVRLFQTDGEGNVTDPDVWVDVLRIDRMSVSEPRGVTSGSGSVIRQYVFEWGDDTTESWQDSPRQIHKYKISQPPPDAAPGDDANPSDPNAPSVVIPLLERTHVFFRGPAITGLQGDSGAMVIWSIRQR